MSSIYHKRLPPLHIQSQQIKMYVMLHRVISHVFKISGNNINAQSHKDAESLYLCATHTAPTRRYWQRRTAIALG